MPPASGSSSSSRRDVTTPSCGFLLVDKPLGVTSFDVVAALRRVLGTRRVGHSGTLDPQATGLLLIGFGPVTRLLSAFHSGKTYEASIRLGASTDTDDAAGAFLSGGTVPGSGSGPAAEPDTDTTSDKGEQLSPPLQTDAVRARLRDLAAHPEKITETINAHLSGDIDQVPSVYSAVRVGGKHAYDLAREGKTPDIAARRVRIDRFEVDPASVRLRDGVDVREELAGSARPDNGDRCRDGNLFLDLTATVTCSEGTYVRSLARDLGSLLGVGGYVTALRRTRIGSLTLEQAAPASVRTKTFTGRDGMPHTRTNPVFDPETTLPRIIPAADLIWESLPAVRITPVQAHLLETGLAVRLGASDSANKKGLAVLSAKTSDHPHTRHSDDDQHQNAPASLTLGPGDHRVVALCESTDGMIVVGVLEDHGRHGLRPRTILDQSFVRLPDTDGPTADRPTHHVENHTNHQNHQEDA